MGFRNTDDVGGDIPNWLHSVQHDRPFTSCHVCDGPLEVGHGYRIMKAYRNDECVFEMAICERCAARESAKWSDASKTAVLELQQQLNGRRNTRAATAAAEHASPAGNRIAHVSGSGSGSGSNPGSETSDPTTSEFNARLEQVLGMDSGTDGGPDAERDPQPAAGRPDATRADLDVDPDSDPDVGPGLDPRTGTAAPDSAGGAGVSDDHQLLSDAREILDELKGNRDDEEERGCSLCGADLEQVRGMSITALCFDGELWDLSHTCTKCEEAMHQALSPETRQEHDRFMETHFPEPPFMEKTPDEPVQDERPDDSTRVREDSWVGSEALGCAVNLKANSSAPDFGGR